MTETQERFLRTVLTRVPLDSVVELHLFPPIRRGTLETGVAVIATVLPPAPLTVIDGEATTDAVSDDVFIDDVVSDDAAETDADAQEPSTEIVIDADAGTEAIVEALADDVVESESEAGDADEGAQVIEELAHDVAVSDDVPADIVSEAGDAVLATDDVEMGDEGDEMGDQGEEADAITIAPPAPSPRMRILTASYRHTIKGVERGKWTVDVQEEADAPLEAVELVLRGVRHRSTEPADPELVTHDALMALLTPTAVAPAA